jgi:hypothetical protein
MIRSVEACAQRYHDPAPEGMSRVSFAPSALPWSVRPDRPMAAKDKSAGLPISQR